MPKPQRFRSEATIGSLPSSPKNRRAFRSASGGDRQCPAQPDVMQIQERFYEFQDRRPDCGIRNRCDFLKKTFFHFEWSIKGNADHPDFPISRGRTGPIRRMEPP